MIFEVVIYVLCVIIMATVGQILIFDAFSDKPGSFITSKVGISLIILFAPLSLAFGLILYLRDVIYILGILIHIFVRDAAFRKAVLHRENGAFRL